MNIQARTAGGHLGATSVMEHLDRLGMHYELIVHKSTYTAASEAVASGVPPHHALKTLVLCDARQRLVLVALPASERLDLHKVRGVLGDQRLALASEEALDRAFPRYDVGAVPPVGPDVPHLALLDERVPGYSRVVCSAGDHQHAVLIIPDELIAATSPRIADICED